MASPASSRKKKKSNKPTSTTDLASRVGSLNGMAAVVADSWQPIAWSDLGDQLQKRRLRLRRIWDWSKASRNPLLWGVSAAEAVGWEPFAKCLAACWSKPGPNAKQLGLTQQTLQKWNETTPLRLQRLPGHPEARDLAAMQLETRRLGREALAVAWLLPALHDSANTRLVEEACSLLLEICDTAILPGECPVAACLWQVELPLTLSVVLPGDVFPQSLRQSALQRIKQQLEELTDGNGMPSHAMLTGLSTLVAGWTRVWQLERLVPELMSDVPTRDRYRLAIQNYLRILRYDGSLLLSPLDSKSADEALVAAWLRLGQDSEERAIADWAFSAKSTLTELPGARLKEGRLSDAAEYTEWGKLAVLRSRWRRKSDRVIVGFSQADVEIELHNKRSWLVGPLKTELFLDEQPLPLGEVWEEICWQSDEDIIYLELQNDLPNDRGVLQRQIAIARKERLCLLADTVLLKSPSENVSTQLKHRLRLPVAAGVELKHSAETREGWLDDGQSRLSVIPVTVPEWRIQNARGKMEYSESESQIELEYRMPSHRLYNAVLIDLDTKRSQKPLSWRHLTVGENLQPVPIDQACGVRIHLHKQQFLLYRSLTPPSSRSLLGQNIYSDFYWGRFLPNGTTETMIMIESS